MPRILRIALLVALAAVIAVTIGGCKKKQAEAPEPKVAPPVIGQAGVLRAGVDFKTPPFAGKDGGQEAGLDIDVAAAIAERLGLQLVLVEVAPDKAADAIKADDVDIVMSVPLSEKSLAGSTIAGTYLDDAPVFFGMAEQSKDESVTIQNIGGRKVAAQKGSLAFWLLQEELGSDAFTETKTLRDAFKLATSGEVDLVAGDAITGSYVGRDYPDLRMVGQVAPATRLGVAVDPENTRLADVVRATLDDLAADGVLDTVQTKWVGDMPELELPKNEKGN